LKRGNKKKQNEPEPEQENTEVRKKVKIEISPGVTYEGEMLRGLYDGKGILYNKLNTYNGDFK